MAETETVHWWFVARRAILERQIVHLLPRNCEPSILEVGCGTGGNLEMLGRHGRVSAIEKDDVGRAIAIGRGTCADIRTGACPDEIPFTGQSFDLICMFDVLEHIERDVETLSSLRPLLGTQGRMLITVPAYQWLWSSHDDFLHHKRRYSARTLRECIGQAGLVEERLTYFNTLLFPAIAAVRLKERLAPMENSSTADVPSPRLNAVLQGIFSREASILDRFNLPFGVSLLAVLRAA